MHNKMCRRSSNTGQLTFQDCRVPRDNLLGKRGEGFHQMLKTLDGGRLSIGAMGLEGLKPLSSWLWTIPKRGSSSVGQ